MIPEPSERPNQPTMATQMIIAMTLGAFGALSSLQTPYKKISAVNIKPQIAMAKIILSAFLNG